MDRELFIRYFTGSISHEEEKALLSWIDESESNRREFFRERQLWDMLLLNNPAEQASPGTKTLYKHAGKLNGTKWIIEFIKVAAVFLIAFLISYAVVNRSPRDNQQWNTIEMPGGQRTCLKLSDGTTVWLNAKTVFSFPDRFNGKEREVRLDGEAIFKVTHNEKMPFVVKTQKYNLKVLGTEFNVYAYSNSKAFETTLINGKVLLEDKFSNEKPITLKPNQMAFFNETTQLLETKTVDASGSLCWKDGFYSFNNQSLASIIRRLEQYYEVIIHIKNPAISDYKFTGKFRNSSSIDDILEVIKKSSDFKLTRKGNEIIIE